MADTPEMFGPTKGFSGMADSMEPYKMLWGQPLLPWQRNFGKFGLFFHKIAYKSACMPDRPDMFGPTRGDDQGADLCCHHAMATTFALGAESNGLRLVKGIYIRAHI